MSDLTEIVERQRIQEKALADLLADREQLRTHRDQLISTYHELTDTILARDGELERLRKEFAQLHDWRKAGEIEAEFERLENKIAMLRADNDALRAALLGYQSWHKLTGTPAEVPIAEPGQIT